MPKNPEYVARKIDGTPYPVRLQHIPARTPKHKNHHSQQKGASKQKQQEQMKLQTTIAQQNNRQPIAKTEKHKHKQPTTYTAEHK